MTAHGVNPNIRTLEFSLLDGYSFRCMLEILKDFRSNCWIKFTENLIEICANGINELGIQRYVINTDEILSYTFPFKDLWPSFSMELSFLEFFNKLKAIRKKDIIVLTADVDVVNMTCPGFYMPTTLSARSLNGGTMIVSQNCAIKPPTDFNDFYEEVYIHQKPNSKIPTEALCCTLISYKNENCDSCEFELDSDNIITVRAYKGTNALHINDLPRSGLAMVDSKESKVAYECDDGTIIDDDNSLCRTTLSLNDVKWLEKLGKLAPNSLIKVYMSRGYPFLLQTNLGLYGMIYLSFKCIPT